MIWGINVRAEGLRLLMDFLSRWSLGLTFWGICGKRWAFGLVMLPEKTEPEDPPPFETYREPPRDKVL